MFHHILTATDGSDYATKGLTAAIDLAAALKARLTILHASELYPDYAYADSFVAMAQSEQTLIAMAERGRQILEAADEMAKAKGVETALIFMENAHPATAIDEQAETLGCDLIVIGSRGRRGLTKLFLGSQAAEVLAGTKLPVLIIK